MPSDSDVSDQEADTFAEIVGYFENHPDPRCLPLLIGSVSRNTGLGMYQHITFVLLAHDRNEVVPYLRDGLREGSDAIKWRCCHWAADVGAWELEDQVRPLIDHVDEEVREAAWGFLESKADLT